MTREEQKNFRKEKFLNEWSSLRKFLENGGHYFSRDLNYVDSCVLYLQWTLTIALNLNDTTYQKDIINEI